MNKLDLMKNLAGVGYAAPTVEVCFVNQVPVAGVRSEEAVELAAAHPEYGLGASGV